MRDTNSGVTMRCALVLAAWLSPAMAGAAQTVTRLPWWLDEFWASASGDAMEVGMRAVLAILLFLGGWVAAKSFAYVVFRVLERSAWDDRIAAKLHIDTLIGRGKKKPDQALERGISSVVYYLLMGLVVVGVLEFAGLSQAAEPIQTLVDTVAAALPLVGKAVLLVLVAWAAATILSRVVTRALDMVALDERFAKMSSPRDAPAAQDVAHRFSETAGRVVYWLIMLVGLAGAFDALKIAPLAEPLRNVLNDGLALVPVVSVAALIVLGGWIAGKIARVVVTNLLEATAFDALVARIRLSGLFGAAKPSFVAGWLVMAFVYLQTAISALDRLGLHTLSTPLTNMVGQFWAALPALSLSVLIVVLGVFAGGLLRRLVTSALQAAGFDRLMDKLGFGELAQREDRLGEPSEAAGFVTMVAVALIAIAQALHNLGLDTWAAYVDAVLQFAVTHVLVALLIVGIGFAIGNYVRDLINARQAGNRERPQWLGEFARYTVLVFAFTMAIHQLGVAEEFVLLSFALLFGSLCLAMGLAFGLGSREVAGEIVRQRWDRVRNRAPTPGAKPPLIPPGG